MSRTKAQLPPILEAAVQAKQWTITVPGWEPVRVNQLFGCHWSVAARKKKSVTRMIRLFASHVPKATGKRRVTLKVTLAPRMRADPDCYWKTTLDSLVHLGLLVDDRESLVELMPVVFDRGPVKATMIILEDVGGGA